MSSQTSIQANFSFKPEQSPPAGHCKNHLALLFRPKAPPIHPSIWCRTYGLLSLLSCQIRSRKRLAKTVLVFVGLFALCWLPSHVIYLYRSYHYDQVDTSLGHFIASVCARILAFTNSCVNPFALYLMSKSFRKHFKKQLLCCSAPRELRSQSSRSTNVTTVWTNPCSWTSHPCFGRIWATFEFSNMIENYYKWIKDPLRSKLSWPQTKV